VDWPVPSGEVVLTVVEAAAVLVSAIAGMMVAAEKKLDIVGAFSLACVNAFGGGTVRDLLLDNRPFYWMQRWWLLIVILAICVPFVYNARMYRLASELHRRSLRIDALGLALFTIAGVGIARQHGAPLVVAAMMGVVTGTMGGVMRDVVVNELPDLFRPGGLYATAALAGALAFLGSLENGLTYSQAVALGVLVVLALRLVSLRHGVSVPAPHWQEDADPRRP
jgi:uncharacterized membrane protein YeiH